MLLALAALLALPASAAPSPFAAVFVDAKTEAALGPFPLERRHYADALKALRKAGARAVVFKYFFELPKDPAGDAALEAELKLIPSFLQARIDETTADPNPFPERFLVKAAQGSFDGAVGGGSGWVPIPAFAKAAAGMGFVDLADPKKPTRIPLVEVYKGKVVPSLYLSVLQWLTGAQAGVTGGKSLTLAGRTVALDAGDEAEVTLPSGAKLDYIPFLALVQGRVPAARLKGKVVVLGYDGPAAPSFDTPVGKLGAHRLFFFALEDLYRKLGPAPVR